MMKTERKNTQKNQEKTLSEIVDVVKNMVDKDPVKDLVSMVREEMKQSRAHELQLYQLMFNSSTHNNQMSRQIPETPHFFQHDSYYQIHSFSSSSTDSMNRTTIFSSETSNVHQNSF